MNNRINRMYGQKDALIALRARVFSLVSVAVIVLLSISAVVDLWDGSTESLESIVFSLSVLPIIAIGLAFVYHGHYEQVVPIIFYTITLVLCLTSIHVGLGDNPQILYSLTSMFFPSLIVGAALFIGLKVLLITSGVLIVWLITYWFVFCADFQTGMHLVSVSTMVYNSIALIMLSIIVVGLLKISQAAIFKVNKELIRNKELTHSLEKRVLDRTYALVEAKAVAEEASKAKTQFLETISHEMRTPLNGIIGMNSLLTNTELNEEQKDFVDTSLDSARGLLALINDILDMSRIDSQKVTLELAPINISKLLLSMRRFYNSDARRNEIGLTFEIDEACDQLFMADEKRIRQVLQSLISNAIKFTEKGSVTVIGKVLGNNSESPLLHCTIKDTGIGVDAENADMIFEKFRQLDQSRTRKFEGSGLGLAIAKSLVELMGGEIGVNEVNVGSEFWFTVELSKVLPKLTES
ncbi:MAG: hypothetical protein GX801_01475 [Fibrobacter sp.]|nr:hypothetical protein [Fibrobacter sp.]